MKLDVSHSLAANSLELRCTLLNNSPRRVYVLHLNMSTGKPELWIHHAVGDPLGVDLGVSTMTPSSVPQGMSLGWLSRSAGEPVEPGAAIVLERTLPIPIVASQSATRAADSPDRYTTEVDALVVRCFYATPPDGWERPARPGLAGIWDRMAGRKPRPARAIRGGYDLPDIASETIQATVTLPRPVPLVGSRHAAPPPGYLSPGSSPDRG